MNKILVIVVTYNAMQWAERCFDSLRKSSVKPDVYVVDNGSNDGTQAYIQEHFPEVMFHQSKENLGFGKANNLGLQYALDENYDFAYLLNQDAWVMEETFERLIELSSRYPKYGILSPFQMNADLEHIDNNFILYVMRRELNSDITNDLYNRQLKEVYPVSGIMAAHWFITRACLLKVGGFSPSFPHYAEDDNYADRMHFWGLELGVVPSLRVVHDRGWREASKKKFFYIIYTSTIRVMSYPDNAKRRPFVYIMYELTKNSIYYKSLQPIKYLWRLILKKRVIEQNRIISATKDCAFLKMKV